MIGGVQPGRVQEAAPRGAAPARAVSGKALPVAGEARPVKPAAAPPPPDLSRAVEMLDRYLADSQRTLQFRRDPDASRTIILVVDPSTGEVLRQIPGKERLAIARTLAAAHAPVIDLMA